jgi:glycerol uptake facilitator-like aquaporin
MLLPAAKKRTMVANAMLTIWQNTPRARSGDQSTDLPTGPNPPVILYISFSFAVSLAANVWIFYRISGGMFNPAVRLPWLS